MKVLVTGAQGFVGRYVVSELLEKDAKAHVVGLGRSDGQDDFTHIIHWRGAAHKAPLPTCLRECFSDRRYTYRKADLLQTGDVAAIFSAERFDVIIHLATALRDEPFDTLVKNNICATASLFAAVADSGVRPNRIVIGSTGSIFSGVQGSRPVCKEDDPVAPLDLYAVSKLAAENIADVYRRTLGMSVVIARIFNVVGVGQDERHLCGHLAQQFAERSATRAEEPVRVGPLESTRDFIDVRDVARGLVLLGTHPEAAGIYNLASGRETHVQEVYDLLSEVSGHRDLAVSQQTKRLLDTSRQYADIERIGTLGFAPRIRLRESLEDLYRYYAEDVASCP